MSNRSKKSISPEALSKQKTPSPLREIPKIDIYQRQKIKDE